MNESQNASLTATLFKRSEIVGSIGSANEFAVTGRDLTRRSRAVLSAAKAYFQNVDGTLRDLNTLWKVSASNTGWPISSCCH